jgi:NAD(P)H dehydrogenase (quinone)
MKVFIVYAHPESLSLNGALKDVAVSHLTALGHAVQVSDLYAMQWKASADAADFITRRDPQRLNYPSESKSAYKGDTQTENIKREQEKLLWADAVIFQFPMWWFSMPAILKGWIDRVYACGFAYGVGRHEGEHWGRRYGEGTLEGRRAMLSITIGGRAPQYSERGVNGELHDLLFPIHHGILFYPGMRVLSPHIIYEAGRMPLAEFDRVATGYKSRLDQLFTDDPIPYRMQNHGHYDSQQVLKPGLGHGQHGTRIHLLQPGDPPQAA